MPQHKSNKKRMRQDVHRRLKNRVVKSQVHTAIRKLENAKPDEMPELLRSAHSELDNAERKGVLKENTVNRKKSRLAKWVAKQTQTTPSS
ncbi:MAG: 30S ribosomal protein S20 [Candidatus Eisenbacteria bacterium]|uniref:Small ribosomal subunit protein bS20 n=1 Tax=Eiseniibacteriota bacterium TaxID=2212470 RepID=A0A948WBU1_UNCEI|nr:30S ribosomal protein S20 [Candidatus Eisenbacteria bacterium]MBU1947590.1 30S ribosomal protein S20 [Candidatus Eisenbacteria bacterium]MBU2690293.1 30S ribosomal protein S20 [Candidatus Eisenbacteria bacterium]